MPAGPGNELATGGTISYVGDYVVHVLANGETFEPIGSSLDVEVLRVAGGGSGGPSLGGGGGAGEATVSASLETISGPQTATVGAGGVGVPKGTGGGVGTKGSDTTFAGFTVEGGGYGSGYTGGAGGNGGNGGGGGTNGATGAAGGIGVQHNGGSNTGNSSNRYDGGGGGGAGGDGANGSGTQIGGLGIDASDFGLGRIAGGGGGNGTYFDSTSLGAAGTDGGGDGGDNSNGYDGLDATTYGSGGGGADYPGGGGGPSTTVGGEGFAGVVAVRYESSAPPGPTPVVPLENPLYGPSAIPSAIVWVSGLDGSQTLALRDIKSLEIEDRLGDVSSLTFEIALGDPRTDYLGPDQILRWTDRYFRIVELDQSRSSRNAVTKVYAEALWTDLARRVIFGNFPVLAKTVAEGLDLILAGTGWTAGTDPEPGSGLIFSAEGFDESVLSHLRRWADVTGYEIEFDTETKTVSLVDTIGEDRGVGFRYGSNVTSIRRRYEPPRATVLYPVGANSLTIESVHPDGEAYIENFDWYVAQGLTLAEARTLHTKEEVWVDTNYLTAAPLFDRGTERLATRSEPVVSYEASVVDLSAAVGTVVPFEVGDLVKVRDASFDVDIATRIVRRVYRPNEPTADEIELSYLRPSGTDSTETRERDYGNVSILVDQSEDLPAVSAATDWATIQYNSTGSASTVVTGGTFYGIATGAGTVRHSLIVDTVKSGAEYEFEFADGDSVEFSYPSFVADVEEGSHTLSWRVQVISGAGTIAVAAEECRGWIITTGAFGLGVNTSPNRRIVEELLALDSADFVSTDTYAVVLNGSTFLALVPNRDLAESETLVDPSGSLGTLVENYLLPFTIGDPTFGAIEGPGVIPSTPGELA